MSGFETVVNIGQLSVSWQGTEEDSSMKIVGCQAYHPNKLACRIQYLMCGYKYQLPVHKQ